jgi:hypothetical protein
MPTGQVAAVSHRRVAEGRFGITYTYRSIIFNNLLRCSKMCAVPR